MNRTLASRALIATFCFLVSIVPSIAAAEYRVTAFGDSTGFDALLQGDEEAAKAQMSVANLAELNFAEANNLCVAEILGKDFESAMSACLVSLDKIKFASDVSPMSAKSAKASIYSNLAVAKALAGDLKGASTALEVALVYKSTDSNALNNFDLVSASLMALEIAQN